MFKQIWRSSRILFLALSFIRYYWQIRFIVRFRAARRQELEARVFARAGARVRISALRLQGLIVKVGQFLSARADVLPLAFTRELTQLQDAVPAVPFSKIRPQIESELGADLDALFAAFAPIATAAASLGQVHRATLADGREVAVKVLRPGIAALAHTDLSALRMIAWYLETFTKFGRRLQLTQIYEEFSRSVQEELDYRLEADYMEQFRKYFQDSPHIAVPGIVDRLVTRSVIVMDFIDGCKISDSQRLAQWGVDPEALVETLVDAYLRQMLKYGLVHVDPHPGNLLVLADGRLCFIDFGMMAQVQPDDVSVFASLVQAAISRNLDGIVEAVDKLGFLQPHANRAILKQAVGMMLDRLNGFQLARGPELDRFIEDFQDFLHDEPLILQAKYLFIGRAIGMLSGVLTTLKPSIDWWTLLKERALPLLSAQSENDSDAPDGVRARVRGVVKELFGDTGALAFDLILSQAKDTGLALVRLPSELDRVLQKMDRNEWAVQVDLDHALLRLDRLSYLLARAYWTLTFAVMAGLSMWFYTSHLFLLRDITGSLALLFLLTSLVPHRGRNKPRVRRKGRTARHSARSF
ncbi:MAG: AarF/UbiB family protein [Firmicutes bacterium]|nr:AarF/UbiB family protein [Bacillota bacterium]